MATESHKRAQRKAAGRGGETEVPLPGGQVLDALTARGKATEVERSGSQAALDTAARRLRTAKNQSIAKAVELRVPQQDMDKAVEAMQKAGIKGAVSNMGGTKKRRA